MARTHPVTMGTTLNTKSIAQGITYSRLYSYHNDHNGLIQRGTLSKAHSFPSNLIWGNGYCPDTEHGKPQ